MDLRKFEFDLEFEFELKEFEQINWLPVFKRFNQCISSNASEFFHENCPLYLHDLYKPSRKDQVGPSVLKLKHLSGNTCSGHNIILFNRDISE